ncbi:MAG: Integral rane sensor signal transduction histidine kinase [Pedosphaera sp.]|nr:Integral rane sensor signal transduction histidine kinase [Pedosphaera sp.]
MNSIRWQKPKWLPQFLAMPVPEPAQQASRILAIQRNIILPARVMVTVVVFYYLFYSRGLVDESPTWQIVQETLQRFFDFYIIFNAIAAILLILRRFPPRLVQWVVFAVGLVDGLLLAGLTLETNGFESTLFWVFPGLIIVNALSIPLATPQIVLNLSLSAFYLGAGLLYITVSESPGTIYPTPAIRHHIPSKFGTGDILDLKSFTARLRQPPSNDEVSRYLAGRLSPGTLSLLASSNGRTNSELLLALVYDLNHIVQGASIYDAQRFAGVKLSSEASTWLNQSPEGVDQARLNRKLLQDAYPREISDKKRWMVSEEAKMVHQPPEGVMVVENGTEPFVLQLIILCLMTATCYGVQLLLFRERVSLEEERKSAARNDELKAAGRLAAEIAHQLKNPLGIITNAVYSLQKGLKEGKKDFSLQMQIIREEIERSDRILTQLMGYAQLSEGRVEKLNLAEELDRAIAEVLPPGATYETQVHRDYGSNLPTLLMQRNHLSVVLVNLLQNAREALNERGKISMHAHYGDNNTLQIAVQDDGPGIAFEKLDKIFEAYVTTKEKGTGLGLAIVKHNVELYGGAVRVESELGKGARFILIFPAKTFIATS